MKDIKAQFRALVHELDQNPQAILLEYREYLPASQAEIEEVETALGFELPEAIKHFYLTTNGLRLSWIHQQDGFYDAEEHLPLQLPSDLNLLVTDQLPFFDCDSKHESGSISIKRLSDVFLKGFPMNEELQSEGFFVFDAFSMIHGAAISFPKSKKEPVVSFNSDHYTHFDDYGISMSFGDYLDHLILIKGVKGLRKDHQAIRLLDANLSNWPDDFYYCEF